jgi:polysaccharide export outer membrane protein
MEQIPFQKSKFILIMRKFTKYLNTVYILFILIITQTACVSNARLTNFKNLNDTSFSLVNNNFQSTIQKGDILYIGVTSRNPLEASAFNSSNNFIVQNGGISNMAVNTTPGQLITEEGMISLPYLGQVLAKGKTTTQLSNEIAILITPFLKNPIVSVRFVNLKVTVLGEVNRPGVINVTNERISVLEAIGSAGDLTAFSKRNNILLIRDSAGIQVSKRFSLEDKSIFFKPYYFLQPNDVLYIETNNIKSLSTSNIPIVLPSIISTLSFLVLIINQINK